MSERFSGTGFSSQPKLPFSRAALGVGLLLTLSLLTACGGDTTKPPASTINTADSGAGSLREALANATEGATLKLASGTVSLASPLKISKGVTLDLGSAVIDAGGKGRVLEVPRGITVTIKGGTLKGGVGAPITIASVGKQALSVATYGGVISNQGTLTLDGTAVMDGKANLGGGIANLIGGTVILKSNSTVNNNTAQALPVGATENNGGGGGIFNAGTLKMEAGGVSNNSAVYGGGGVYNDSTGIITIQSGGVDNNKCTYPNTTTKDGSEGCAGGGIYSLGNVTLTSGSISGNAATYFGGGIVMQRASATSPRPILTISGGSIENNKTTGDQSTGGGGIWSDEIVNISGGSIKGNSSMFGGGINSWGELTLTGGNIENNTATENGGGIFLTRSGIMEMSGTANVRANIAKQGGGVYVNRTKMTLVGGNISGNTAAQTGGGVLDNGTVTMTGGEISGNSVPGITGDGGGGVRLFAGSTFTASGGSIKNNTATFGGGV